MVYRLDPRGAVGARLFAQRDVHPHMQKRVGLAPLGREFLLPDILGLLQQGMVFGMNLDNLGDYRLHWFEQVFLLQLTPHVEVNLPYFVTRLEHG
jgi:hypothetical protein